MLTSWSRPLPVFSLALPTAIALISEIGVDISVFQYAKHLISWAGCCPRNSQSSKTVKSTRIPRAGCCLKSLLVQVANAVIKSGKYPACRDRYRRIKTRCGRCRVQEDPDCYLESPLQAEALFCKRLSGGYANREFCCDLQSRGIATSQARLHLQGRYG